MLNEFFDKIYVINMEKDKKRYKNIQLISDTYGIDFTKFVGIDLSLPRYDKLVRNKIDNLNNVTYENFDWKTYIKNYKDLIYINNKETAWDHWINHGKKENRSPTENVLITNKGAWGCLLSHIGIIHNAIENDYEKILIFEDDIIPHINIFELVKKNCNILEKDWKLLYLGASQHEWDKIKIQGNIYHPVNTRGTFSYAIHKSIYNELLSLLIKQKKPVDCYLFEIQEKYKYNSYVLYPNLFISDVSTSNIQNPLNMKYWSSKMRWDLDNYKLSIDYKFYNRTYPDLKEFQITTKDMIINHFFSTGNGENRIPCEHKFYKDHPNFNIEEYSYFNPDLFNMTYQEILGHYNSNGFYEDRVCNKKEYFNTLKNNLCELYQENLHNINLPIVKMTKFNILIRTSNRGSYFERCIKSIFDQVYKHYTIIVCYDDIRSIKYINQYPEINSFYIDTDRSDYHYNLHPNKLLKKVNNGFVIFLDDDDMFTNKYALLSINNQIESDNQIIIWKYFRTDKIIFPEKTENIPLGKVCSCSFTFNISLSKDIEWEKRPYADYHFFSKLIKKNKDNIDIQILPKILTRSVFLHKVKNNGENDLDEVRFNEDYFSEINSTNNYLNSIF